MDSSKLLTQLETIYGAPYFFLKTFRRERISRDALRPDPFTDDLPGLRRHTGRLCPDKAAVLAGLGI
jgi:hypothetical protein